MTSVQGNFSKMLSPLLLLALGMQSATAQTPKTPSSTAKEVSMLMVAAEKDLKNQDYGPEEEKLNKVIKIDPSMAKAYYLRSCIKQMRHDLDGALLDSDKAITLDPASNPLYFYQRGLARFFLTQFFDASLDFSITIKRKPTFSKAYLYRGYVYANTGELEDALKDCQAYIKLEPKDPEGLKFKQQLSAQMKSRKK